MKHRILEFLFGEHFKDDSPNTTKGLKECNSLRPSLYLDKRSDVEISYRLVRTKRKTIGLVISDEGLIVRAPHWVSRDEIETLIYQRQAWIHEKLMKFATWKAQKKAQHVRFVDGAKLPYLGMVLTIRLDPLARGCDLVGQELLINTPKDSEPEKVKALALAWFKSEAKDYLGTRLEQQAALANLSFKSWNLSNAKTRWGCCTSARTIRLNWMLIHLKEDLIDYVIAHELAHLNEMNHSPKFWQRVQTLCPDYEIRRQQLKDISISQLPFSDD